MLIILPVMSSNRLFCLIDDDVIADKRSDVFRIDLTFVS